MMTDPTCHVRYLSRLKLRLNMRVTLKQEAAKLKKCAELSAKKSLPILIIIHLKVLGLRLLRSYLKLNLKILGRQAESAA